jgi:hypothetical protein
LPFKRQRQQSFATSSSQEAKVAMYAAKPVVFATRLSLSERKPLALVLEKFQKTEQAAFLDPCGQTFSSLLQASDFLIGNKK